MSCCKNGQDDKNKQITSKEITSKEISNKDISNRDISNKDISNREVSNKEMVMKELTKDEAKIVKHKKRNGTEKKELITRLSRIEGQVRGIKAMVEDDRYCVDILTQVSAIQAALNGFNKELLARHIKTCVSTDIRDGNEEAVDELCDLLKKLMK